MAVPPDSNNPPVASAAPDSDFTLNGATSSADVGAVPELQFEPEVDAPWSLRPEDMPLEHPDISIFPTETQPSRVDIFVPDDVDRSWWSRLLSLKGTWRKKQLRPSAHDEPVTMEADIPLPAALTGDGDRSSLSRLPSLKASSLPAPFPGNAGNEAVSAGAISNLERRLDSLALLRDVCASIDQRLARVEEASGRVETTVQRTEGFVAKSLAADSMIPDMAAKIERQLEQAGMARTEQAVADRALHELCQNIDARLARTEDTLHRSEHTVAERLQELSARMDARLTDAEAAIQRIERMVSSRSVEQSPSRPFERSLGDGATVVDLRTRVPASAENRKPAGGDVRARAALLLSRFASIAQLKRPGQLPWVTGLAAPVLVLVAALAIGSLFRTSRSVAPEAVAPLSTTRQTSTPVVPATNQGIGAPSSPAAVMANAPRSTGERLVPPPEQPPPDRESAPTTNREPRYVGTLSITSVPSGASVSINGKPAGKTPLTLPRQRAGSLAVQIAHDGFERWSAAVIVPADQLTQVAATLRATPRVTRN